MNLAYGEVTGCLEAAHRLLGFQKVDKVRITLYVPCFFKKDKLKQLIKYLPENEHGYFGSFKKGIDISKGVVGRSFRTNTLFVETINEETDFEEHMKDEWGFSSEDVRNMQEKKSYLSIPINNKLGKPGGVLYLDSPKRNIFTVDRIKGLTRICLTVAKWI